MATQHQYNWKAPLRGMQDDSVMSTVEVADNRIYFYADVDSTNCLKLTKHLREVDAKLRSENVARGVDETSQMPIWLHIHSYGGDLFTGFSVADQIQMLHSPVYAVVEGICASAATLIAMACKRRTMLKSSFMLVHQLSGIMWGTHEQFKDQLNLQSKVMDRLVQFYVDHSKVSEDEVRSMLTRDTWLDAETCVNHGFVDAILS